MVEIILFLISMISCIAVGIYGLTRIFVTNRKKSERIVTFVLSAVLTCTTIVLGYISFSKNRFMLNAHDELPIVVFFITALLLIVSFVLLVISSMNPNLNSLSIVFIVISVISMAVISYSSIETMKINGDINKDKETIISVEDNELLVKKIDELNVYGFDIVNSTWQGRNITQTIDKKFIKTIDGKKVCDFTGATYFEYYNQISDINTLIATLMRDVYNLELNAINYFDAFTKGNMSNGFKAVFDDKEECYTKPFKFASKYKRCYIRDIDEIDEVIKGLDLANFDKNLIDQNKRFIAEVKAVIENGEYYKDCLLPYVNDVYNGVITFPEIRYIGSFFEGLFNHIFEEAKLSLNSLQPGLGDSFFKDNSKLVQKILYDVSHPKLEEDPVLPRHKEAYRKAKKAPKDPTLEISASINKLFNLYKDEVNKVIDGNYKARLAEATSFNIVIGIINDSLK